MEILDVVDYNDCVISTATREEIYERKLGHRIVHVLIFNTEGKIALQLRTPNLAFCPNHWSTTAGGHVQSGETYEEGAAREFQEELGIVLPIKLLAKDSYTMPNLHFKYMATFIVEYNGPFYPDPESVQKVDFLTMDKIQKMIECGEKFHPELLFILNKYYNIALN